MKNKENKNIKNLNGLTELETKKLISLILAFFIFALIFIIGIFADLNVYLIFVRSWIGFLVTYLSVYLFISFVDVCLNKIQEKNVLNNELTLATEFAPFLNVLPYSDEKKFILKNLAKTEKHSKINKKINIPLIFQQRKQNDEKKEQTKNSNILETRKSILQENPEKIADILKNEWWK